MKRKLIIFGSILLIATLAIGAELQSFYLSKFGGLNNSVNVRLLQDSESMDISNFSLDSIGSIKERDVFGQYNSLSGALGSNFITGLFKHYTTDNKFFFACAGTKIGLGSAGAFTDITPTNSTVTGGTYYSGVSFNNKFYLFNPNDEMFTYSGTGSFHKLGNSSAIPTTNCSYSAVHKSRVWAARSNSLPYRLYWSSLNNAENWTSTGGYADLPDINQEITGIVSWGGYLYIFTETNIYVLLGSTPNDFSLRKTNSMVGAIAPRSIKITDIGICFLSRSGVYAFDGNNSNKISTKIESTISGISKTLIQNACGIYDGRKYWLAYSLQGASYNNRVIVYDILLKDWVIYQGDACNISYFERAYGGTDKGELYGGSSTTNGIVYGLQSSSGTESITHSTSSDFNNNVSFNTIVDNSKVALEGVNIVRIGSNIKMLLKCEGTDAVTTFIDDVGKVITANGTAQIDTAYSKVGGASGLFDGNSDYLTTPAHADFNLGTGNFAIMFWVRFNTVKNCILMEQGDPAGGMLDANLDAFVITYGQYSAGNLLFWYGNADKKATFAWTPSANVWYHIAFVRDSTNLSCYVDGIKIGSSFNIGVDNIEPSTMDVYIGAGIDSTPTVANYFDGWLDEIVFSKGTNMGSQGSVNKSDGVMTSNNIQINASGLSSLGDISWINTIPTSNTKITFQTRTGTTNDSVYFNGWQYWSSTNSVTLSTVTNATTMFKPAGRIQIQAPIQQTRNITNYEDEDSISVNSAQFQVVGAVSTNAYVDGFLTYTDLSNYDWLSVWYKSPATGNSVEFYMSNNGTTLSDNCVTFNTVTANTWEKAYWYIGNISDSLKNGIRYIRVKYKGDNSGYIYLGEVEAHNYYNSEDTILSTPNDWIQYRAILGTNDASYTPNLSSITLTYTPTLSASESSLASYYYTKWFDFKTPQLNKQFDSLILEVNSTTASSVGLIPCTIYCDYDIDFGTKTGTLSFIPSTTANTVRVLKNFPASTYGKAMRLKIYNNDLNAQVTLKGCEIRYRTESVTPD